MTGVWGLRVRVLVSSLCLRHRRSETSRVTDSGGPSVHRAGQDQCPVLLSDPAGTERLPD